MEEEEVWRWHNLVSASRLEPLTLCTLPTSHPHPFEFQCPLCRVKGLDWVVLKDVSLPCMRWELEFPSDGTQPSAAGPIGTQI